MTCDQSPRLGDSDWGGEDIDVRWDFSQNCPSPGSEGWIPWGCKGLPGDGTSPPKGNVRNCLALQTPCVRNTEQLFTHQMRLLLTVCYSLPCSEEEHDGVLSKDKLITLCKYEPISKWMRSCDHILYQTLVEILIPDVLRPVPSEYLVQWSEQYWQPGPLFIFVPSRFLLSCSWVSTEINESPWLAVTCPRFPLRRLI